MRSKGQLFSLDLIIAVALVILAIGLLYRQAELFQYFQKDDSMQAELYRIGLNASNQLVGNTAIVCKLGSVSSPVDYLPNCLPKRPQLLANITKNNLGIPAGFDCLISAENNPGIQQHTDCKSNPTTANVKNVFAIERQVVFLGNAGAQFLSKLDFDNCIKGQSYCNNKLSKDTVTLKVWKT